MRSINLTFLLLFSLAVILGLFFAIGICSSEQSLAHSDSDGISKEVVLSPLKGEKIRDVSFPPSKDVFILTNEKRIYIKKKNESSWKILPLNMDGEVQKLHFINSNIGWLVGRNNRNGVVWKTIDGGKIWQLISELPRVEKAWEFMEASSICFLDEQTGYLLETFSIWKTRNSGRTWEKIYSLLDNKDRWQPINLFALSKEKIFITGTNGVLYKTDDGVTWKQSILLQKDEIGQISSLKNISFINEKNGWISTDSSNQLYRTKDGSDSWKAVVEQREKDSHFESFMFFNERDGLAVLNRVVRQNESGKAKSDGESSFKRQKFISKTSDGGKKWKLLSIFDEQDFQERITFDNAFNIIFFEDSLQGWVVSENKVFFTYDGGKTFNKPLSFPQ